MDRDTLVTLSKDDLVGLIEVQASQITLLTARIAELKANLPDRLKKRRDGRPGVSRALAEHPDRIIEATLTACPHCANALSAADQPDIHAYDHIELAAISPTVTRINRHRGICPCCHKHITAPAPKGLEPGSPFGPGLCALIIHLHVTQAISFERLARLLAEVFGLTISEGAIANILARAQAPLLAAAAPIADAVRASPVVGSDETSARVGGKNWWQWVLLGSTAVYHVIADTRAASVVTSFMDGALEAAQRAEVWVADRYGGQLGHAAVRQMCLALLLRDATYAIDEGDHSFALGFRFLLLRAVSIGQRRDELKDSTLTQYHADLERRLDRLLAGDVPDKPAARRLFRAMRRDRDDLFRFITRRDVPYTNNACERALRPSVIFRKVTGGFRAEWGAKVYAAAASVIATGRLYSLTALAALRAALSGEPVMRPG